jgi:hypothetical protein
MTYKVHDLYYTGISIGWNWGLERNRTSKNVIEFNHVHDLGQGVLSDSGLIYCLGVSPGSVIRNNVFHDLWPCSAPALGWGIYLDAHCGNYLVESNLVYNTLSGGLMFNNGGHETGAMPWFSAMANGYYVLLDYDGRPKPTMMAYSGLESMLMGAKPAGVMRRDGLTVHAFERANGAVAVVWSARTRPVSVPPDVPVFDLMANEMKVPALRWGEPAYIVAPGLKPAQLQESLR